MLQESLREIVNRDFPVHSHDLKEGSGAFKDFVATLDAFLMLLQKSSSAMVLEVLLPIFKEPEHRQSAVIREVTDDQSSSPLTSPDMHLSSGEERWKEEHVKSTFM